MTQPIASARVRRAVLSVVETLEGRRLFAGVTIIAPTWDSNIGGYVLSSENNMAARLGGFQHTPNIDAVLFFAGEIYPLVQARLPGARFYIIGDKAPTEVIALASENIIVTGLQPDIRPYFNSVKLSVAPLRFGAGVKGKINQSMGFGVPVVATSMAVEGMALTNREDILIADRPGDFAQALVEVYECEELWNQISENGIEKTRAMYSSEVARKQLSRLFSDSRVYPSAIRRAGNESTEASRRSAAGMDRGVAR